MILYLTHAHLHSHSPRHYYNICVLDLGCYQWECWGCDPRHLPSPSPQSFRWGVCASPVPEGEECPRSLVVLPQQVCVCMSVCALCFLALSFWCYQLWWSYYFDVFFHHFSYDSMIPSSDLGGVTPEPTPPPPKQWWVSSRWLTDSDQFNEWMTEEDYELIVVVRK